MPAQKSPSMLRWSTCRGSSRGEDATAAASRQFDRKHCRVGEPLPRAAGATGQAVLSCPDTIRLGPVPVGDLASCHIGEQPLESGPLHIASGYRDRAAADDSTRKTIEAADANAILRSGDASCAAACRGPKTDERQLGPSARSKADPPHRPTFKPFRATAWSRRKVSLRT